MTTPSDFAREILALETERNQFGNTLIEIRQILGITDNEVWTQQVLRDLVAEVAALKGEPAPELSVVPGDNNN